MENMIMNPFYDSYEIKKGDTLYQISKEYNVSRNAIYHQLSLIEKKLNFFEEKLNLYSKKQKVNDIIDLIEDKKAKRIINDLF